MDQHEIDLLEKYSKKDDELKALWEEHMLYDKQVEHLSAKSYRTPTEEQTLKQLKKQKLENKTALMDKLESLQKEEK